jgi:hypothetical protein
VEKIPGGQAFLAVRVLSAKSKRDRQECPSYSSAGELLLEALRFIVLDEGIDERGEFSFHHLG